MVSTIESADESFADLGDGRHYFAAPKKKLLNGNDDSIEFLTPLSKSSVLISVLRTGALLFLEGCLIETIAKLLSTHIVFWSAYVDEHSLLLQRIDPVVE